MKIYTKQEWDAITNSIIQNKNTSDFETACSYFRQICQEIRTLIGNKNFKGSFDELPDFYNNTKYKEDKGMQLAIALNGCTKLCEYEAKKLGIINWLDRCWQLQPQKNILYYNLQLSVNKDYSQNIAINNFTITASTPQLYKPTVSNASMTAWEEQYDENLRILQQTVNNNIILDLEWYGLRNIICLTLDKKLWQYANFKFEYEGVEFTITPIPVYQE